MKKVLILTTSTGQGHNKAANSLIYEFSKEGFECIKHDFLASNSKLLNNLIVKGYEISATNLPAFYGWFYKITDTKVTNKLLKFVFYLTGKKLLKTINKYKPDLIIGTHPLSVNIVSKLKHNGLNIPFISVVTDFKAHYTYVSPLVDAYITGSKFTNQSLIDRGINKNILFPFGIPISESFYARNDTIPDIKDNSYFNILLMSGSMGLINISYVLDELLNNEHKLRITAVCGNNSTLKNHLEKKASDVFPNKKLHILGFSNDIASLMEYSDVIISKPGGLTVSEAIIKNLPLIIPFSIPGQEMENTDFLTTNGYAFHVENLKDINLFVNKLIESPEHLLEMKSNLKLLASSYSIRNVITISKQLMNEK